MSVRGLLSCRVEVVTWWRPFLLCLIPEEVVTMKSDHESRERRTRSCLLLGVITIAMAAMLSGCATVSEADASLGDWVEPGWVAQFRQDMEEDANAWIACFAESDARKPLVHTFKRLYSPFRLCIFHIYTEIL